MIFLLFKANQDIKKISSETMLVDGNHFIRFRASPLIMVREKLDAVF